MGNVIQMYANSGKITTTADSSALVLILKNGNRYEELNLQENIGRKKKTLSQLNFKELQVNLEVEDLKLKRSNEDQFKHNGDMMNVWQLDSVADSTKRLINKRLIELNRQAKEYFYNRIAQKNREPDSIKAKNKNPVVHMDTFLTKLKKEEKEKLIEGALNQVRSNASYIDGCATNFRNDQEEYNSYLIEWHKKIVVCFACIVLFFVGAPLGAIIRKGGLGLPVVVAVMFFLAYFILTDAFMLLAIDGTVAPWLGMWSPVLIFLPISIYLTYKAANDSALFDFATYFGWIYKLKLNKKKN
jgi:lipopolysaccharide export system permease protein